MTDMKNAVFEQVAKTFSDTLQKNIHITEINQTALDVWANAWQPNNPRTPPNGGWDWNYKTKEMGKKYEKHLIGIAIWLDNTTLCGLALCQISKRSENISIHYIERSPDNTKPLKGYIFKIVQLVCLEYAFLTKKTKSIRIIQPIDNLISLYEKNGFKLHKKLLFGRPYCEKHINN